jgi:diamine N-acetyltransferase
MPSVVLAPLTAAHAEAMLRWMRDADVAENLGLRSEPTLDKTLSFIARAADDDTVCARAVVADGEHVGNVVLDMIDRRASKARLHIYLGEEAARGRGVGRSAVKLALDVAFDELAIDKVWLTVHARNARAIAAYQAVGFVTEGVHREEFVLGDERIDEIYMGILRRERRP